MIRQDIQFIRDAILLQALPDVAFDGWAWDVVTAAAGKSGYDKGMERAVFPGGLVEAVSHFSDWVDRQMLAGLAGTDPDSMRVRDRIKTAVMSRVEVLSPWREASRRAVTYWSVPTRHIQAGRILWRSADCIWRWAGDTATDYNHYTKRALLSGVISATTFAWLNDETGDMAVTEAFVDRRIENVLQLGKIIGRVKRKA